MTQYILEFSGEHDSMGVYGDPYDDHELSVWIPEALWVILGKPYKLAITLEAVINNDPTS